MQSDTVNETIDLAKAISDHGLSIILSAIFILFTIAVYKRLDYFMKKSMDKLFEIEHGRVQRIDDHDTKLAKRFHSTTLIQSSLHSAMVNCGVQTMFVIEFHNSVMNIVGIPFAKCTITYETSNASKPNTILPLIQDLPISIFGGLIIDMPKTGTLVYTLDELAATNSVLYSLIYQSGFKSIAVTKLLSNNMMVGLLVACSETGIHDDLSVSEKLRRHSMSITDLICMDR
jgi:hypothetical protein